MAASGAGGAVGASGAGGAFGTSSAATWRSSAMILQPSVHSQAMLSREKALDVRMGAGQKKASALVVPRVRFALISLTW